MKSTKTLQRFRIIAIIEGISYLVLLFIAMPLKYFADFPYMVTYFGWLHGLLFVIFGILLIQSWGQYRWSFWKAALAFISSLIPFGTFIFDRELKKDLRNYHDMNTSIQNIG